MEATVVSKEMKEFLPVQQLEMLSALLSVSADQDSYDDNFKVSLLP